MTEIEFSSEMEVTLDAYMGTDEDFVRAMIISTNQEFDGWQEPRDSRRIGRLIEDGHTSPFEMNEMRFIIECPLFVIREMQRYRTANMNEVSGRYTQLKPKFYCPKDSAVRKQVGKPMSYTYETMDPLMALTFKTDIKEASLSAYEVYLTMLQDGLARELARCVLPVNIYTKFFWKNDFRNVLHFLYQRNAPPAMLEIRELAEKMEKIVAKTFPKTYNLWIEKGRPKF